MWLKLIWSFHLILSFCLPLCLSECKIDNCEACFNRNFCTKCKEGLYSHSGRCYVSCPPDQHTANETMECVGEWPLTFNLWPQLFTDFKLLASPKGPVMNHFSAFYMLKELIGVSHMLMLSLYYHLLLSEQPTMFNSLAWKKRILEKNHEVSWSFLSVLFLFSFFCCCWK